MKFILIRFFKYIIHPTTWLNDFLKLRIHILHWHKQFTCIQIPCWVEFSLPRYGSPNWLTSANVINRIGCNITTMWAHECQWWTFERWLEFLWATRNLWRILWPHKQSIPHINKNIPSTWTKYYINVVRIFF